MSIKTEIKYNDTTIDTITSTGSITYDTAGKYLANRLKVEFTGPDDATASASDILSGKTAYISDGSKATGTIQTKTGDDITSVDGVVTIPKGYYAQLYTKKGDPTGDATLSSSSQLASGITAYSKGVKYTGTLASYEWDLYRPMFVEASGTNSYYSTDGVTWLDGATGTSRISYCVSFGNKHFVSAGSPNGTAFYSADGINWSSTTSGLDVNRSYCGAAYGNNRFVCVGYASACYSMDNGVNWTAMSFDVTGYHDLRAVTYGNDRFVCVGVSGKSFYSTNGTSWISMTGLDSSASCYGVTYGNGRFVCVGKDGISYYSTDGETWVAMSTLSTSYLNAVTYGNGRFVCVSNPGKSYYSTDGLTWSSGYSIGSSNIKSIVYGNGRFICGGPNGASYYSTDGTTWTHMSGGSSATFYAIGYGEL